MLGSPHYLGLLALLQFSILGLASPVLQERKNQNPQQQKCSNAPNVIAGNFVKPEDTIIPPMELATDEAGFQLLFCVPNTETYLFFDLPKRYDKSNAQPLHPDTNYAHALDAGIAFIQKTIETSGDKEIPNGGQTLPDTDFIRIYAEDAGGAYLTWGVFGSALTGLNSWMRTVARKYSDATFQINDGPNLVGQGYLGSVISDGSCIFHEAAVADTPCVAYDKSGDVYAKYYEDVGLV